MSDRREPSGFGSEIATQLVVIAINSEVGVLAPLGTGRSDLSVALFVGGFAGGTLDSVPAPTVRV